jgi:hypothetical protein
MSDDPGEPIFDLPEPLQPARWLLMLWKGKRIAYDCVRSSAHANASVAPSVVKIRHRHVEELARDLKMQKFSDVDAETAISEANFYVGDTNNFTDDHAEIDNPGDLLVLRALIMKSYRESPDA